MRREKRTAWTLAARTGHCARAAPSCPAPHTCTVASAPPDASSVEPEPVLAVTPPTLEPAPIKAAYSPDGYGEPGATTIIQRSYDDVVHTPRRLSIDGDDPLEGDEGVWGQYLELDETESAQRVPALIVVPYLSPPIDIAPTSPTTRRWARCSSPRR